ncbi:MAG: hypothetical protein ABWX90_01380 [Candidatus Saccharimonadales bacterium]
MERESYSGRVGRALEVVDIERLESAVLLPAVKHCEPVDIGTGNLLFYKNDEIKLREDGLRYRHEFYATTNKADNMPHYSINQQMFDETSFDALDLDHQNIVIAQFQRGYEAEGGSLAGIATNPTWQALFNPESYSDISLTTISTKSFIFTNNQSLKSLYAERQLKWGNSVTVLDRYVLDARSDSFDKAVVGDWLVSDIITLDRAGEDICTVTTKDMNDVVDILEDMGLVSYDDRYKYVSGI